jgi:hypothetical protein
MNQDVISRAEKSAEQSHVFRHAPMCVLWAVLLAMALGATVVLSSNASIVVGLLVSLFALQGLIAEILGVRVDATYLDVPRRPMRSVPLLVLWRQRIHSRAIRDVTSISTLHGLERVMVKWEGGATLTLMFLDQNKKYSFFQVVNRFCPEASIYRRR